MFPARTAVLLAAGVFATAAGPEAQARVHARQVAPSPSNPSRFVAFLLSNQEMLLAFEQQAVAKESAEITRLLRLGADPANNPAALAASKSRIAFLQGQIDMGLANIQATQAYTVPGVRALLPAVSDPTLRQQFALLLSLQALEVQYFAGRPSATPFAA